MKKRDMVFLLIVTLICVTLIALTTIYANDIDKLFNYMPTLNSKGITFTTSHKPWEGVDQGNYKLYNSTAWRRNAKAFLKHNPLCKHCQDKGMITQAIVCDHIIPINDGGEVWEWSNLQGLCKSCNAVKTAGQRHRV